MVRPPTTTVPTSGEACIAAVEKSGKVLQVGSQYMSMGAAQKAADFIRSGRLGQVTLVEGRFHRNTATGAWYYPIPPDASPTTVDFKSFLGSAAPRDFDLVTVPFAERGRPELVHRGGRRERRTEVGSRT